MEEEKKRYKFRKCCEVVEMTPVEKLFSKKKIQRLRNMDLKQHQCHHNSFQVSLWFGCGYCEGVFCGCCDHAFNFVEKKGKRYYFDATAFSQGREEKVLEIVALRRYKADDIIRLFSDCGMVFVTTSVIVDENGKSGFIVNDNGEIEKIEPALISSFSLDAAQKKINAFNDALKKNNPENKLFRKSGV